MVSSSCIVFFLFLLPLGLDSATLTIRNECSYTVWAAFLPANGSALFSTTGTSRVECAGGIPAPVTVVVFDGSGLNLYNIILVGGFNFPVTVSASGRNCSATGCLTNACPMKLSVIWNGLTVACKSSSCRTEPCSSIYTLDNQNSFPCSSSSNYSVTFCYTSKSWMKGHNKVHSEKKLLKYTGGVLAVICFICGFIIFQIRFRLSNSGWELSFRAGIRRQTT